jgi:hypothetical protein
VRVPFANALVRMDKCSQGPEGVDGRESTHCRGYRTKTHPVLEQPSLFLMSLELVSEVRSSEQVNLRLWRYRKHITRLYKLMLNEDRTVGTADVLAKIVEYEARIEELKWMITEW